MLKSCVIWSRAGLLALTLLSASCEGLWAPFTSSAPAAPAAPGPDSAPPAEDPAGDPTQTGARRFALEFTGTGPVALAGAARATPVTGQRIQGIDRLVYCAVDAEGRHVHRNVSVDLVKEQGRVLTPMLELLREGLSLSMLILADDEGDHAFLVRPRSHGSLKLLMDDGDTLRLDKDAYVLATGPASRHAPLSPEAPDHNHDPAEPWCLVPDEGVPPPEPATRALWLEIREPNPAGDPESPDPNELFPLTAAFYTLRQGARVLASGALAPGCTLVPWNGQGRFLSLLIEKPGYQPERFWLDGDPGSGTLLVEGLTHYLEGRSSVGLPLLVTLQPEAETPPPGPARLTWDWEAPEGSNSGAEGADPAAGTGAPTWTLHRLDAAVQSLASRAFDPQNPGVLELAEAGLAPLGPGESLAFSGPAGAFTGKVKLSFRGAEDEALGTFVLLGGAGNRLGTATFKDEGALPDFGVGPTAYPAFFLAEAEDFFFEAGRAPDPRILFVPAGSELIPQAWAWP